ncbi:MAG: hypothetical protein HFI39_01345, partial [Lachnospiraceae bacterium]|nr:hypothetical protein [Lachnospiraceae bacterium]
MAEARQTAVNDAVAYLQGNLSKCAEVLMGIVRDKEAQPQVRINAVNSVFAGIKGLSKDNREVLAEMAVKCKKTKQPAKENQAWLLCQKLQRAYRTGNSNGAGSKETAATGSYGNQ